jgi:hypothetical protein
MAVEEYVIIVRGERFVLARDQMLFDSPNYFTSLFDGPFRESSEGKREAVLYRDPFLFRIIESYLAGYQILPLPTTGLPQHMSYDVMVKNLLADAQFYQLEGLINLLEPLVNIKYKLFMNTYSKVLAWGVMILHGYFIVGSRSLTHQLQGTSSKEISIQQANAMVEYAKQSATCTVLDGFHLNPHNEGTCFAWVQQCPYEWKERDSLGASVAPYMAYSLVWSRIVPSKG